VLTALLDASIVHASVGNASRTFNKVAFFCGRERDALVLCD
jgi:hypothetical protein